MKKLIIVAMVLLVAGLYVTSNSAEKALKVNTGGNLLGGTAIEAVNEEFEKQTGVKVESTKGPQVNAALRLRTLMQEISTLG